MKSIEMKITTNGHVYGHVQETNLYLLRWMITNDMIIIINDLQQQRKQYEDSQRTIPSVWSEAFQGN